MINFLRALATPLTVWRSYRGMNTRLLQTETWLADVEADHDTWEPDELWASRHRNRAAETPTSPGATGAGTSGHPHRWCGSADAEKPAQLVSSVGGPLKSDEQIIDELVADYRELITECLKKAQK